MGKVIVSNDSVPNTEVSTLDSTELAPPKPGDYLITVGDAVKFGFCCLTMPAMVLAEIIGCKNRGKNLRWLVSSRGKPSAFSDEDLDAKGLIGCVGLLGACVGVGGTAILHGTLPDFLINGAEGFIAAPFVAANLGGAYVVVTEGVPMAFKAAAHKACRPVKALRNLANKPLSGDPRLMGPK